MCLMALQHNITYTTLEQFISLQNIHLTYAIL